MELRRGSSRDSLYLSDTVRSRCPTAAAVRHSWKASPVTDYALLWPATREPAMTQQHALAWRAGRRNTVPSPRELIGDDTPPYFSTGGAKFQSRAPHFVAGHPKADKAATGDCCVGVAHRGCRPRSCRSAKRAMPRRLERAEEPRPPVPIRLCADNCTRPGGSHPNKLSRERKGRHQTGSRSFFSH